MIHDGIAAALAGQSTAAREKAGRIVFVEASYTIELLPPERVVDCFDRLTLVRGL